MGVQSLLPKAAKKKPLSNLTSSVIAGDLIEVDETPATAEIRSPPAKEAEVARADVENKANVLDPAMEAQGTVALCVSLNRQLAAAQARVKRHDFSIEGLVGFDMQNTTVGVIGPPCEAADQCVTLMQAFGAKVLRANPFLPVSVDSGNSFVSAKVNATADTMSDLIDVYAHSDIVVVHGPRTENVVGMVNQEAISALKAGSMLLTSRASMVDVEAALSQVDKGNLGYFGSLDAVAAPHTVP